MSKTLLRVFGPAAEIPEVGSRIQGLLGLFNFSAEDLLVQWETYKSNVVHNTNEPLSEAMLDGLHNYIQEKISRQNERSQSTPSVAKLKGMKTNGSSIKKQQPGGSMGATPLLKKRKLNFSSPANTSMEIPSEGEVSVNNTTLLGSAPGEILESLAPTNLPPKETTNTNKDIVIGANFDPKKYRYRTQNLKTLEIADYLDDQIDTLHDIITRKYHCENEFGDPNRMSQSTIVAIGRIVPDSPLATASTELNLDSLFLETARSGQYGGYGKRVKLDFSTLDRSDIGDFSLFPGQLVAFRGINNDGLAFKVSSLLKIPYLGANAYSQSEMHDFAATFGESADNLKVSIACGPFHGKSTLDFSHLATFVNHLNTSVQPDVVILLGPFLDVSILTKINVEQDPALAELKTPEQIFQSLITPILTQLECSKVILVAHGNDITMAHNVYPQPGFNRKELGLPKQFKCFPNPSVFHLNEVGFGVSNIDIFRGLKDIPLGGNVNAGLTRIDRVVSHILQQRHFHPHMACMSNDKTDVDVSYLGLAEIDSELPDVLILPSVIKRFAKVVKNVVVINPGQLVRGDRSGSFAVLQVAKPILATGERLQLNSNGEPVQNQILPGNEDDWVLQKVRQENDLDEEEVYEGYLSNVWKRCRVDLYSV